MLEKWASLFARKRFTRNRIQKRVTLPDAPTTSISLLQWVRESIALTRMMPHNWHLKKTRYTASRLWLRCCNWFCSHLIFPFCEVTKWRPVNLASPHKAVVTYSSDRCEFERQDSKYLIASDIYSILFSFDIIAIAEVHYRTPGYWPHRVFFMFSLWELKKESCFFKWSDRFWGLHKDYIKKNTLCLDKSQEMLPMWPDPNSGEDAMIRILSLWQFPPGRLISAVSI